MGNWVEQQHSLNAWEEDQHEIEWLKSVNAELVSALEIAREYVVRIDGTMAFTSSKNRLTAPDLAKIDTALARAKES